MRRTFIALAVALGFQYLLLHSHKVGAAHWAWVSGGSLTLFTFVNGVLALRRGSVGVVSQLILGVALCTLIPPIIYLVADWLQVSSYVLNSLSQGGLPFVLSITFVSGGWLFAAVLVLCQRWRPQNQSRLRLQPEDKP